MGDQRHDAGGTWALLLAAGPAVRFGGAKQFATLGGKRLIDWVVETASQVRDETVVVLTPGVTWDGPPVTVAVPGGAKRAGKGSPYRRLRTPSELRRCEQLTPPASRSSRTAC